MALRVAILEPYYGGSHRVFVDTCAARSRHDVRVATLPARKWKWRMRGAAIWFAMQDRSWMHDGQGRAIDVILCNDMLGVSDLRALLPADLRHVPVVCYVHENQLTYPPAPDDVVDYQYGMTNITSCLSADRVLFNSAHHRAAFLEAAEALLRRMPDFVPDDITPAMGRRSDVAYPPIEVDPLPAEWRIDPSPGAAPRILWSHRWEYDKNPGPFFEALTRLADEGVPFALVCLGEQFRTAPPEFAQAMDRLGPRLAHAGYVPSRDDYLGLLRTCDVVVSSAIQENFGVAVLEAVASGCQPVVPHRLAYPEVLPERWHARCTFDGDRALTAHLRHVLTGRWRLARRERAELSDEVLGRFGAEVGVPVIDDALESVGRGTAPPAA